MIIETAEYNIKLITVFIKWYFIEMPLKILHQTYKYILALSKIYSFIFLLKTFFLPWKGQLYEYPQKGFDIKSIFEVWISNMISRIVGAFIRFITIIVGIIFVIFLIFMGILLFLIWITYPILFFVLVINNLL